MAQPSRWSALARLALPAALAFVQHPLATRSASHPLQLETPTITASATAASSPSATAEPDPSGSPTPAEPAATPSETPTQTATGAATVTETASPAAGSPSPTGLPGETPTPPPATASPTEVATPPPVRISEIAWAGTLASASDEWIELHNPTNQPVDLSGWLLTDDDDISVALQGSLAPYGFFVLERTDDSTISSIAAHQIYTGGLNNGGEALRLLAPGGAVADTANGDGGPWPAGNSATRASMERRGTADISGNWVTFAGTMFALDAAGNWIPGTPGAPNSSGSSATSTPSASPSSTATPTSGATTAPTPSAPRTLLINEVAWAGTGASASDEWIELYNPGTVPVGVAGWRLTDSGDIDIRLSGSVPAHGFYLLERTDDTTVSNIPANLIYAGGLSNAGESLVLTDATGAVVDTANGDGGSWPAGSEVGRLSMERRGLADRGGWSSYTGYFGQGLDARGGSIAGTPGSQNSVLFPTPTPTWIPGRIVINELLPRPRHDWEGKGGLTSDDEYVELLNLGPGSVRLEGWSLDDAAVGGSAPFTLPARTLAPGEFAVYFRGRTNITLNDRGDSVRLEAPDGRLVDKVVFLRGSAVNLAYGRLPDGSSRFSYCLWPTPGRANVLFHECAPDPVPARLPLPAWLGSAECDSLGFLLRPLPRPWHFWRIVHWWSLTCH